MRAGGRLNSQILKAEALQAAILNSSHFSSIATDAKGVIQVFNVGAEHMLGYRSEDVVDKMTPAELSDPQEIRARAGALSREFGTTITAGFEALIYKAAHGIEDIYELTKIRKDGSRFPAVVSVTALRDAQENIIGYLLIGTDNTAHKTAENALHASEALGEAIIASAMDAIISIDGDYNISVFNQAAEKMFGYSAAQVCGTGLERLMPLRFRAKHNDHIRDFARTKTTARSMGHLGKIYGLRANGEEFPMEVAISQMQLHGNRKFTAIIRDTTERIKTEMELAKTQARFQAFFDLDLIGMAISSPERRLLNANSQLCRILGYERDELMGLTWSQMTHADDLAADEAFFERMGREEIDAYSREKRFVRKDGKILHAKISVRCVRLPDGTIDYLLGLFEDISPRIEAELARYKEAERFAQVVENIGEVFWLTDLEKNQMIYLSPQYEKIWGRPVSSLYESLESWPATLHAEDRARVMEARKAQIEGTYNIEYRILRPDGEIRWVHDKAFPVRDENNKIYRIAGVVADITDRLQAEHDLKESEAGYRRLFEAAKDGILILNADTGEIQDVNPFLADLLGYSHADFIGKQLWQIGAFKDIPANKTNLAELQQNRYIRYENLPLRTIKGDHIFVEFVSNSYEVNGRQVIQCNIRDISERRKAATALRKSTDLLKAVVANAPLRIFWKDRDLNYLGCNLLFAQDAGETDLDQIIGKSDFEMSWKDQATAYRADDEAVLDSGKPKLAFEERQTKQDGSSLWLRTSKVPLRDENDHVIGILGIYEDITESKRAVDAVKESESRFRQLAETIQEIFFLTDPEMTQIFYVSPAYTTITGRSCESLYANPQNWLTGIHPDDMQRVLAAVAPGGKLVASDVDFRLKDLAGHEHAVRGRAFPILNAAGETYRFAGLIEDQTRQKHVELQLQQAQKMEAIGRLSGGIAHDFNNLLTVILGHASILETLDENREAQDSVAEIRKAGERAAGLTRQLLLFSRREKPHLIRININTAILETTKMLLRILGEDILLDFKPLAKPIYVQADAGMLDQVLVNLAVNARDAMPKGGRLTIETAISEVDADMLQHSNQLVSGAFAVLSVSDSGCGIPAEILPKIFEPFFTTKDVGKGTGLGLATAFGIVQQHSGWIKVYSEVGYGTTFRVYLPVDQSDAGELPEKSPLKSLARGSETLLVVEDESGIRTLLEKSLSALGYEVLVAKTGPEALKLFAARKKDISLVLTDMVMPGGMTGTELGALLHKEKPSLHLIYSSGYSDAHVSGSLNLTAGVNFLAKPYSTVGLSEIIRRTLDTKTQ